MQKRNLKVLINDLERAIAEIKSEVYSDTAAYRIDRGDGIKSYTEINDEDGECDKCRNFGGRLRKPLDL